MKVYGQNRRASTMLAWGQSQLGGGEDVKTQPLSSVTGYIIFDLCRHVRSYIKDKFILGEHINMLEIHIYFEN